MTRETSASVPPRGQLEAHLNSPMWSGSSAIAQAAALSFDALDQRFVPADRAEWQVEGSRQGPNAARESDDAHGTLTRRVDHARTSTSSSTFSTTWSRGTLVSTSCPATLLNAGSTVCKQAQHASDLLGAFAVRIRRPGGQSINDQGGGRSRAERCGRTASRTSPYSPHTR